MTAATAKKKACVKITALECKACERCILACPVKCLELGTALNERGYRYAVYKGKGCIACGNCFYSCPEPLAVELVESD